MKHMAQMGHGLLQQQQAIQNDHRFTQLQMDEYSKHIGACQTVEFDPGLHSPMKIEHTGSTVLESASNPSGQLDQIRCVVLEILAEEGLIPGGIK